MKCDQCESTLINGFFCHEIGCPNFLKDYDRELDEWYTVYQCDICGCDVRENEICSCYEDLN